MRSLMWVPIVHSPEDLGSLPNRFARLRPASRPVQWDAYLKNVDRLWKAIPVMMGGLGLDWTAGSAL